MDIPSSQPAHDSAESRDQRSLAELTKQLTTQASALAQKEIELAKAELALKGKRLGVGVGAFGAAGLIGLYALGALTAAVILGLEAILEPWLAALLVAVAYGALAGVLALAGKKKVEEGTPPMPQEAIESAKTDVEYTKERVKEGRQ
jgi:hypothetical protein